MHAHAKLLAPSGRFRVSFVCPVATANGTVLPVLSICTANARQCMQVVPNTLLSVSPDRGHVAAESGAELELSLTPQQPGQLTATLELEVRGSKPLKLLIRCAMMPCGCAPWTVTGNLAG
jgi:hypothetical protein